MSIRKTYCRLFRSTNNIFGNLLFVVLPAIFVYFLFIDSSFRDNIFLEHGWGDYIFIAWGVLIVCYILCIVMYLLITAYTPFRNKYLEVYCNINEAAVMTLIMVMALGLFDGVVVAIVSLLNLSLIWFCDTILLKNGVFTFVVFVGCVVGIIYVIGVILYNVYCKKDVGEES